MYFKLIILFIIYQLLSLQTAIKSIKLERTLCYGECPPYSVEIYSDGKVLYQGEKFVRTIGKRLYSIPIDSVAFLFNYVERIKFFSFDNEYVSVKHIRTKPDGSTDTLITMVTDLPTQYVTVNAGDRSMRVKDYFGSPANLRALERLIDRIAVTSKWVKRK